MKSLVRVLLIGLGFVVLTALWCWERQQFVTKHQAVKTEVKCQRDHDHIPNIYEIQQMLIDQGFGYPIVDGVKTELKVDGKWQKITDKAYCDWCASKEFERWDTSLIQ